MVVSSGEIDERLDLQRDTLLSQSERLSNHHDQIGAILARLADQDAELERQQQLNAEYRDLVIAISDTTLMQQRQIGRLEARIADQDTEIRRMNGLLTGLSIRQRGLAWRTYRRRRRR